MYPDKMAEYQREWMRDRRKIVIEMMGGMCFECGETTEKMAIVKRDRDDKEARTRIMSWSFQRMRQMLPRLRLLCSNCYKKHKSAIASASIAKAWEDGVYDASHLIHGERSKVRIYQLAGRRR